MTRVRRLTLFALLLTLTPAVAGAQVRARQDAGPATVGGGYARLYWNGCCANGIMVDFAYDVYKHPDFAVSLMADFSRTKFSGAETEIDRTYTGGVRVLLLRGRRINATVQGAAGVVDFAEDDGFTSETGTQPLVGFGAAFLYNMNEYLAFRLQGDWWRTKNGGAWEPVSRMTLGAVFRFGGR